MTFRIGEVVPGAFSSLETLNTLLFSNDGNDGFNFFFVETFNGIYLTAPIEEGLVAGAAGSPPFTYEATLELDSLTYVGTGV